MFERFELVTSFTDEGNNIYNVFDLIDSDFQSRIVLCERTGKEWSISEESKHRKSSSYTNYYNGIIWSIYKVYKNSRQCVLVNIPLVVRTLFSHIPLEIKRTEFYVHYPEIVERGLYK